MVKPDIANMLRKTFNGEAKYNKDPCVYMYEN